MSRSTPTHRKVRTTLLAMAAAAGVAAAVPAVAAQASTASTASCAVTWGSLVKSRPGMGTAPLTNVRSGRHTCYDRLVLDVAGATTGYQVSYVDQVRMDGSGDVVPLRGGAKLQVILRSPAYDDAGNPTYTPANRRELVNVTGYSTFRQVAWAGSFEGQTTLGLGVRARLPMNVFVLAGPGTGSRLVIDVAHHW
ncbi:MAG TPA: hypothetical protein VFJ97_00120 [Dermatophilaceae bacterium]|nr:hypothetical protein [Dermatophilaceae bacterium]